MQEILSSIGHVSGIMHEISIATSEQMKGIQEINHSVNHLDRMVQQNAGGAVCRRRRRLAEPGRRAG